MPDIERTLKYVKWCSYSDCTNKWITNLKGIEFNYYYFWRHFGLHNEIIIFELANIKSNVKIY